MTFKRAYLFKQRQLLKGLLSVFLLIASVIITNIESPPNALADSGVTSDASWMPFKGEYIMWCTLKTGGSGPCGYHHGTWGIDFELPFNHPVYSAGAGTVKQVFDGCPPATGSGYCNGGAGNWISVDHGDHWARYIHLASLNESLEVGDWVEIGDLIGYAGCSGCMYSATHLHYDETLPQNLPVSRIYFGQIYACHGNTKVTYPDYLGTTNWQEVPFGTLIRNDGYECANSFLPDDTSNQVDQDTPGFLSAGWIGAESGDRFGSVTDTGDFDGDGRMDLLVSAPEESVGSIADAGLVHAIYGSGDWSDNEGFYQNTSGWPDVSETGDRFGSALTTGDFNNDGFDDMVIGSPYEDLGGSNQLVDAGIITVAYGSTSGLTSPMNIHQYSPGVGTNSESGDLFGAALASGDINGDGYDDVVVGVPGEGIGWGSRARSNAGAVHILYGSASGLTGAGSELFHQNTYGVKSKAETGDAFGEAVTTGDINGDGYDDVVVGVPGEGIGWGSRARSNAGAVHILYGSASGASGVGSQWFYQDTPGWPGRAETNDRFGSSVAVGDIDGDGAGDLVIGVPGEKLGSHTEAGQVQIRYNPGNWSQTPVSVQTLYQNATGVQDRVETGDRFGAHLEVSNVTGDSNVDLIVGIPGESIANHANAGAVAIFKNVGGKITTAEDQILYADQNVFTGESETDAEFGSWFSALNGNLIIGSPGRTVSGLANAGAFYYLDL